MGLELELELEVGRQSSCLPIGERKVLDQRAGREALPGVGQVAWLA